MASNQQTDNTHNDQVEHQGQNFATNAYESGKDVALQCKNLACEGSRQLCLWAKKHPKETIAFAVAALSVIGLITQRNHIKKFDAQKKIINPLARKTHQAKDAVSDFWQRG